MPETLTARPPWSVVNKGYSLVINDLLYRVIPGKVYWVDVETDENEYDPKIVGLSFYLPGDKTVYYYSGEYARSMAVSLKERKCLFSGHNVKGDLHFLFQYKDVSSDSIGDDSMMLAYSINPTLASYGLKELCKAMLGIEWPSYRDMVGKGRAKLTLDKHPIEQVAEYCGMDCLGAYLLSEHLKSKMTGQNTWIYDELELPTYKALFDMEVEGAKIDQTHLRSFGARLKQESDSIRASFYLTYGADFNPGSPKQVQEKVFGRLQISEKSTNKESLKRHSEHEDIKRLMRLRGIDKLRSTYTESLVEKGGGDGVIHCRFNQVSFNDKGDSDGIDTTRLSSSGPNLQNIPVRSEEGKEIRKGFVSRYPKGTIVSADYSQIEYRLLAHFTEDPVLIDAFMMGRDVHEETARLLFGVKEVTDEQRFLGKTINFAAIYGARAEKIAAVSGKGVGFCQDMLEAYFKKMPKTLAWIQKEKTLCHVRGYTETLFGRQIPLPDIHSRNRYEMWAAERMAVNYKIQGSASEIMKFSLTSLKKAGILPNITVHDEFDKESWQGPDKGLAEKMKEIMENVVDLKVPLIAEVGIGVNWAEAKG